MTKDKNSKNVLRHFKKQGLILLGRYYTHKKQYQVADMFYGKALDTDANHLSASHYHSYAYVLYEAKQFQKALFYVNAALEAGQRNHSKSFVLRGQIYLKLKRYAEAEYDLQDAIGLESKNSLAYYILGIVFILEKKWHQAVESLQTAKQLGYDTPKFHHRLGEAHFHMQHFKEAAEYFEMAANGWGTQIKSPLQIADLYYLTGVAWERAGNASEKDQFYLQALENDAKQNSQLLGVGVFHERFQQYDLAIAAYQMEKTAEPLYRLGLLYEKYRDITKAVHVYENVLSLNQLEADYHFRLGLCYKSLGKKEQAAICLEQAIARSNQVRMDWYMAYLDVLAALEDTEKYDSVAREMSSMSAYLNSCYLQGNKLTRQARYQMFYQAFAIQEKTVLLESMSGNRVSGNPLALFKEMLTDKRFEEYTFIWTVNNFRVVPEEFKHLPRVIFVNRYTDAFYKYLSAASILVNDVTFPEFFVKKTGQTYLNTWHGTPWKTLGYDVKTARMDYANTARNFLQATHLLLPNSYTYEHQLVPYQVAGIYPGEAAITGYPRIDLTYQAFNHPQPVRERLGIEHTDKKVILYAPTWRGENAFKSFDKTRLIEDLERLSQLNATIIFRGHQLAEALLSDIEVPNVLIAPVTLDMNELLGIVDILITDYSSLFFDFLVTNRPIVHYIYDYDIFEEERGLYFGTEELPGEIAQTRDEMLEATEKYLKMNDFEPGDAYKSAQEKYVYKDNGRVTTRVIDWFIYGEENDIRLISEKSDKEKILFHAGSFQPNGITSAFINLVHAVDKEKYDITVVMSDAIIHHPARLEQLERIKREVNIIPRTGHFKRSDEGFLTENMKEFEWSGDQTTEMIQRDYHHEFKRLFGSVEFDYLVDYSGYSPYYNQLLVSNPNRGAKHTVYVHNDIYSEYISRHPRLYEIFEQYKQYDKVVSVSQPTSELNQQNLQTRFEIPEAVFDFIDNIQDPASVREKSKADLEKKQDEELFKAGYTSFVTMGRLSEEKDQEKLIRAFEKVYQERQDIRLFILGDGPLKYRLNEVIEELRLKEAVYLLGQKKNPYPYLQHADCFVLPSNYEGQPVVLYEALILQKPIIATDIVSNRGVLEDGYGKLCDNSVEGLREALNHFLTGEFAFQLFDIEQYNQQAIDMLYDKVL